MNNLRNLLKSQSILFSIQWNISIYSDGYIVEVTKSCGSWEQLNYSWQRYKNKKKTLPEGYTFRFQSGLLPDIWFLHCSTLKEHWGKYRELGNWKKKDRIDNQSN